MHQAFLSANVKKDLPNRDITKHQVIQLLDYNRNNPIVHRYIAVLITTGERISEISTTKVSDLTREYNQKTNTYEYWLEVIGKENKKRSLLIHDNVFQLIVKR